MTSEPLSLDVGQTTVTVLTVSYLHADLSAWLTPDPAARRGPHADLFRFPVAVPVQSVLITTPEMTVLVDPGTHDLSPDSPYAVPGYRPPPPLEMQMAAASVTPDAVTHVVFTHGHFDHVNGSTRERKGTWEPVFTNARHYFGRADWEAPEFQELLRDPASTESRTLGVLFRRKLLSLVVGERALGPGVTILPGPGESPGHQMVRLSSKEKSLYCLGDLFHHPVEVQESEWVTYWQDAATTIASRQNLFSAAVAERALLVATHIPGVGCLRQNGEVMMWDRIR